MQQEYWQYAALQSIPVIPSKILRRGLEAVAFSLLSAGIYCKIKTVKQMLMIGMQSICIFHPYPELKEICLIAFSEEEANALVEIASKLDLMPIYMLGSWSSLLPRWI